MRDKTSGHLSGGSDFVRVSENQRYLVTNDGRPFFWLGDTAWLIFYRLTREEVDVYLRNRKADGFNVIQIMTLAEQGELKMPNVYGDLPLIDQDPTKPNEKFFEHVDYIVRAANDLGICVALLPTWGDKLGPVMNGKGPKVFTGANARVYGRFLGERYKDANVVWVLGGDRPTCAYPTYPDCDDRTDYLPIWREMAAGVKEGDNGKHLMTYHPCTFSSETLHNESWLDFNMTQSGHSQRNKPSYEMAAHDYQLTPVKPTLDAEIIYEDHPIGWKAENGWSDDYDVRKAAYWTIFAGSCGITYGCVPVWEFRKMGDDPVWTGDGGRSDWIEAMGLPGARQMGYLRALMESRPYLTRIPDQNLIAGVQGEGTLHMQATRDAAGSYAFVYMASAPKTVTVNTALLSGGELRAWWFDPRKGKAIEIGLFSKTEIMTFAPPLHGVGIDFVLVLDDAAKGYSAPGTPAGRRDSHSR